MIIEIIKDWEFSPMDTAHYFCYKLTIEKEVFEGYELIETSAPTLLDKKLLIKNNLSAVSTKVIIHTCSQFIQGLFQDSLESESGMVIYENASEEEIEEILALSRAHHFEHSVEVNRDNDIILFQSFITYFDTSRKSKKYLLHLAHTINDMTKSIDYYEYHDVVEDSELHVHEIFCNLAKGNICPYIEYFEVNNEGNELEITKLLHELKNL